MWCSIQWLIEEEKDRTCRRSEESFFVVFVTRRHTKTHTHTLTLRRNAVVLIEVSGWHGNPEAAALPLCDISISKTEMCVCVCLTPLFPLFEPVWCDVTASPPPVCAEATDHRWTLTQSPGNKKNKKWVAWIIGPDESITTKFTHNMEPAGNVGKFLDQLHF